MLTQEARSKKHTYCMVPSVHTSKLALVVMIVKTLEKREAVVIRKRMKGGV